ncbi:hypothetical protein Pmani_037857 [Petrolisthes manimaculis]|uniref:Uncharacterized protein n=1 Tax=Petrolisthes manimaculis TaxID=1843537 RepID=A0AAE1TL21_9EUCA|nr:hypothetical protein Pmani_037857 [Petrolisthes manimaculis]
MFPGFSRELARTASLLRYRGGKEGDQCLRLHKQRDNDAALVSGQGYLVTTRKRRVLGSGIQTEITLSPTGFLDERRA